MPKYKEVKWDRRTARGYEVFVYPSGTTYYTLDGKSHRVDGPASIHSDGHKEWHLNGKLHREDGPAVIYSDGTKEWCLNGGKLFKEDFTSIKMIKQLDASELFTPQELAKLRLEDA